MPTPIPKLTDEQAAAIDQRLVSVALSAGAGCGKTTVLTQRFLSHLDPQGPDARPGPMWGDATPPGVADLEELVAITFTDAASREMRDRIRSACRQQVINSGEAEAADWLALLRRIDAARISTIHSFCSALLRQHGVEAGIDPGFDLLVPNDQRVVIGEVIDDCLRERLARNDEPTIALLTSFDFARLKTSLRELVDRWDQRVVDLWLDASPDRLVQAWRDFVDDRIVPQIREHLLVDQEVEEFLDILQRIEEPSSGLQRKIATVVPICQQLLRGEGGLREFDLLRSGLGLGGLHRATCLESIGGYEVYKQRVTTIRQRIDDAPPPFASEEVLRENASVLLQVLRLAADITDQYRQRKRELGRLDNDDLLRETHALLTNPGQAGLRRRLADQTRLLLVDEFQDTDSLQMEIVSAVCDNSPEAGKLFCVGDVKQSIYRFRGAQPEVFRSLQQEMDRAGCLSLTENFRSQPAIIRFVNDLFGKTFPDEQPLIANRPQETPEPSVEFLWTQFAGDQEGADTSRRIKVAEKRREEARAIAGRLSELIHSQQPLVPEKDQATGEAVLRPLACRDVVILFRALSDIHFYETALQDAGLDYYLVGGKAYYSQQEVYDVLNLLRVVESSCDDIALAGVLRSPLFGIRDETLYLCVRDSGALHVSLLGQHLPDRLAPEERSRLQHAFRSIGFLRQEKDKRTIAGLLELAIELTGYDAVALTEFLGERKLANLQKLLEQAHQADQGGVQNLSGFIAQLEEFIAHQPPEGLAATCPEDANVIRLMTIHHAKGLEFPCVVLADINRKDDTRDNKASLHPDLGPIVTLPEKYRSQKYTSRPDQLAPMLDRLDEEAELARLLYVAVTRAADYLILSAAVADDELHAKPSNWVKILANSFDLDSGRPTDQSGDGRSSIRVTKAEPDDVGERSRKKRSLDLVKLLEAAKQQAVLHPEPPPELASPLSGATPALRQLAVSDIKAGHHRFRSLLGEPSKRVGGMSQVELPGMSPLDVGTLCHLVLQRVLPNRAAHLQEWCHRLVPQFAPAAGDDLADSVAKLIGRLLESPRGKALSEAEHVMRELEFSLRWPLGSGAASSAVIRGVVDCLAKNENGEWEMIDFKTDANVPKSSADIPARYMLQLGTYAVAVEEAFGESPARLVLHFLQSGDEYGWQWDTARRDSVLRALETAIII